MSLTQLVKLENHCIRQLETKEMNMPRNTTSGSDTLGLAEDVTGLDLDGVSDVPQGKTKFADFVIKMDRPPVVLIPTGTVVELEIKGAKPGNTLKGFPKLSILYVVNGGDYDGETFYDDLSLVPANGVSKGNMWRFYDFLDAVDYHFPEGTTMSAENVMELLKEMGEALLGETLKAEMKIQTSTQINPKTEQSYEPRNGIGKFLKPGARSLDDLLGANMDNLL